MEKSMNACQSDSQQMLVYYQISFDNPILQYCCDILRSFKQVILSEISISRVIKFQNTLT